VDLNVVLIAAVSESAGAQVIFGGVGGANAYINDISAIVERLPDFEGLGKSRGMGHAVCALHQPGRDNHRRDRPASFWGQSPIQSCPVGLAR